MEKSNLIEIEIVAGKSSRKIEVDISDEECMKFGFKYKDIAIHPKDGAEVEIGGVGLNPKEEKVLYYKIPALKGLYCCWGGSKNLLDDGFVNKNVKLFWDLYDEHLKTERVMLRPELSRLLSLIEDKEKRTQLLRPEKGWNDIIAWQILRDQKFSFGSKDFSFSEGEIITLDFNQYITCIVFLTRVPFFRSVNFPLLKPGHYMNRSHKEDLGMDDSDWNDLIEKKGLTDERGLYLPLYEIDTVLKLMSLEFEKANNFAGQFLKSKM